MVNSDSNVIYDFCRIAARIAHRMEELASLPTNMSEDIRIKAEIEYRSLRELNFQRQLRAEVSKCVWNNLITQNPFNLN